MPKHTQEIKLLKVGLVHSLSGELDEVGKAWEHNPSGLEAPRSCFACESLRRAASLCWNNLITRTRNFARDHKEAPG